MADDFEPLPALERLVKYRVEFVVIGGLAGILRGSAYPTYDLDIVYARDRENLERLADALQRLGATPRGAPPGLPFVPDAETLAARGNFTFDTDLGPVDILAYPEGGPGYDELLKASEEMEVGSVRVPVASLDHLIRMKDAAGRTKDKLMATEYRMLADEARNAEG